MHHVTPIEHPIGSEKGWLRFSSGTKSQGHVIRIFLEARRKSSKGLWHAFCYYKIIIINKTCLHTHWMLKITVHFCYLSIHLGIENVFCSPVLQRMARMEIGPIETKKVGQIRCYACKNPPTLLFEEICFWYFLHSSTGTFCVWVKALSYDLRTELT